MQDVQVLLVFLLLPAALAQPQPQLPIQLSVWMRCAWMCKKSASYSQSLWKPMVDQPRRFLFFLLLSLPALAGLKVRAHIPPLGPSKSCHQRLVAAQTLFRQSINSIRCLRHCLRLHSRHCIDFSFLGHHPFFPFVSLEPRRPTMLPATARTRAHLREIRSSLTGSSLPMKERPSR